MRNCVKQADLGDQLIRKNRNFDIIPAYEINAGKEGLS